MKYVRQLGHFSWKVISWPLWFIWGSWKAYSLFWKVTGALAIVPLFVGFLTWHYVCYNRSELPNIQSFIDFDAPTIGTIYDANGHEVIELANEYRRIITYEDIPAIIEKAILSAEDKNFYSHNGIDWAGLGRAAYVDTKYSIKAFQRSGFRHPTFVIQQGASTLTDQIVGLYFFSHIQSVQKSWAKGTIGRFIPRKLTKKLEELRLAVWLEEESRKPQYFGSKEKAKKEILARVASYVYLKNGRYGFSAASEFYMEKPLKELAHNDADKAALLAGIIKNPGAYGLSFNPNKLELLRQINRRNQVLDLMVDNGYLSKKEADIFKQRELPVINKSKIKTVAPSVVGDIFKELRHNGQNVEDLFDGKIQIYSTVDLNIQNIINAALENGLNAYEGRHPEAKNIIQGCVVVLRNRDGAILAQAGGRNVFKGQAYRYSDLNRVTYSIRQPGSAFKPFDYLAAMKNGWTLERTVIDGPIFVPMGAIQVGTKWIKRPPKLIANYDGKYKGAIPLRQALAESRNAAAIWLVRNNGGIEPVIDTAVSLGIKTPLQSYITTALGASEVNLLELTNAYRALAAGSLAEPYMVEKVLSRSGKVLYSYRTPAYPDFPVDENSLEKIREGLRGVIRLPNGTSHALDAKDFGIPVMGKTGTTNDFKDAWFIGATFGSEGITIGAKIGFDDPSRGYDKDGNFGTGPARGLGDKEAGAKAALPIFREVMFNIYNKTKVDLPPQFPEEIENNIDAYLGKTKP